MFTPRTRWCWLVCLVLAGCKTGPIDLDQRICGRAQHAIDPPRVLESGPQPRLMLEEEKAPAVEGPKTLSDRLRLPAEIPGASAADIKLPSPTAPRDEQDKVLQKYFPSLPEVKAAPAAAPGPEGQPITLDELQKIAVTNSPVIRQALADVEAARGIAVQAGLYPNPVAGGYNQTSGPGGGPVAGGYVNQTFKMPGKLKLAQMAALLDVQLNEFKLRQTEVDVQTRVRSGYFDVLVARESLKVSHALARLTDEIFKVMVLQLKAGEVAAYEPMQMRVLALQARTFNVQAHNRYLSAWKQLASAMGVPGMPLSELAGRADMPIPRYRYDEVLANVLQNHTEVRAVASLVEKADRVFELAKLTPYPDADVQVLIARDMSPPGPSKTVATVQAGIAIPVFNRNQGNILEARAGITHARQEALRVRADLTSRLALAFERYENNRTLLELYSKQILPNQVQAFRAAVARHAGGGERAGISYNDVVTAEQNLVGQVNNYLTNLREMWAAVVDVAALQQTNDLFQTGATIELTPLPDLSQLLPVGDVAPCSPVINPTLRLADGVWPPALAPLGGETK